MVLASVAVLGLAACGSNKRQDADEKSGTYKVEVVKASFPGGQSLAKHSNLVITIRNADTKTIPNLALTLSGFYQRQKEPQLADPSRPLFVINGRAEEVGTFPESTEDSPRGCGTAYVNTWACGPLKAGRERTFRWSVTAVKAGPYRVRYTVAAGLNGKAKAVDSAGTRPTGLFAGTISSAAPKTRVADDGDTIVRGTR
jgi:hypothetical protein